MRGLSSVELSEIVGMDVSLGLDLGLGPWSTVRKNGTRFAPSVVP